MPSPPSAAFTAVLYQPPFSTDSNDVEAAASSRLSEPLLPRSQNNDSDEKEETSSFLIRSFLCRLKILSFLTGSFVAILSQYLLSLALWTDAIMTQSAERVVLFSIVWSLATCAVVFTSMILMVRQTTKTMFGNASTMQRSSSSSEWMDATFQMEAHHIIGALLTISFVWIVIDIMRVNPNGLVEAASHGWWSVLMVACSFIVYACVYKCMLRKCRRSQKGSYAKGDRQQEIKKTRANSLMSTYKLIAGTLGLLAGICSQFFLSFFLWKNQMTEPLLTNVALFSLLWSACTVVITFCGCLSLRLLTAEHAANKKDASACSKTFLRMEAYYVFFSLIGICMAWILIDVVLDMREQIFPSLVMLSLSLALFCGILQCFPDQHRASLKMEIAAKEKAAAADIMIV